MPMRRRALLSLAAVAATALAAGCGVEDPYAGGVPSGTTPQASTAAPAAAAAAAPSTTAAPAATTTAAPTAQNAVLRRFVSAWTTWSARDLAAQRRVLVGLAAEPLAAQLRSDAREALRDELERVTTASSSGRMIGTIPQEDGTLVIVTRETAKAEAETEGQPAYHVYLAAGHDTPAGWRLSRWEPTA
jgi:type IV pilus biogenesis protein CpaD/CtpE